MENKQDVVEKRIKPGVIRRRARPNKKEEPKQEAQSAPQVEEQLQAQEAPEVKVKKEAPQVSAEPQEKVVKSVQKNKASEEPVAEPELVEKPLEKVEVTETAPVAAEVPVELTPEQAQPSEAKVEPEKKEVKKEKVSEVQGPRALPEGPPVGTIIQLPKTKKPVAPTEKAAETAVAKEEKLDAKALQDEEIEKAKKKRARPKSNEKGLDVEGFGRVSSVAQIARISPRATADRVFQPMRSGKRKKAKRRDGQKTQMTVPKASKRVVKMQGETIQVSDFAQQLGVRSGEIIKKLMDLGTMATLNESIDFDTATLIAHDYEWEVRKVGYEEAEVLKVEEDKAEDLEHRPPVVAVMGHVDHGKTSLLDAIRSAQVAEGEAGGITQHIGSYQISLGEGKLLTFLDTPGHEAFTAMRARGAAATDIVILVVAADDGVMPQTLEAIHHAQAANVPIIVAVNKIDKPGANPDNIKRQLSEQGLLAEDWGGDIIFANVSAKTKEGIPELLEMIFLQAEVLELQANPHKAAQGIIIEAKLEKGRGPVATALVQQGTLKVGDILVAGSSYGRIRALVNDRGVSVDEALPSTPVEVLGLNEVPQASDLFQVVKNEKTAKQVVGHRTQKDREAKLGGGAKMSLEDLFSKMQSGEVQELPIVIKADVQGSVEALQGALEKIPSEKVKIRVLHSAVGGITESDVALANASNGIIIGFNVRPDTQARKIAEKEQIEIKVYKVIYDVIEDVKQAMEGLLKPVFEEEYLGRAEVRQVFSVSKVGTVAGCYVVDGKMTNSASVRLLRDNVIIHEGKLSSLKRFQDDVREVAQNFECGMGIEGYNDIKEGDVIECFQMKEVKDKL
ncbi:MAG: translation initiation factor IF-2 [Deltaproteobacteria bacterium]|nr:translation initiation factor IF-2 [Deltaproteobacteria bacterium]